MLDNAGRTLPLISCLIMREGPFLWYHACTKFVFIMLGSSASMIGLLQCKKFNCEEKLGFWYCRLLGEALGHLDPLVTWIAWIYWTFGSLGGALGFLTSRTFWQFWHLGNLGIMGPIGPLDLFAIWILDPFSHFDILWSLWWFKLLWNLFGSFLGKLLNSWCFGILDGFLATFPPKQSFGFLPQVLSLHN